MPFKFPFTPPFPKSGLLPLEGQESSDSLAAEIVTPEIK